MTTTTTTTIDKTELVKQAIDLFKKNCKQSATRYESRRKANAKASAEVAKAEKVGKAQLLDDRIELVFETVSWYGTLEQADRKDFSCGKALELVADQIGDASPKTVVQARKLYALKTVELAKAQVDKLGYQAALDTCCKVGAVPALKVASECFDHLTSRKQTETRFFKQYAEEMQAKGLSLVDTIKSFNGLNAEDLKELLGKNGTGKVSKELYDKAIEENKALKAEIETLRKQIAKSAPKAQKVGA